ncbi:uncharacterized protein F4812DRAFT_463274 [Daldinia caldariorum]|uniref:uncharacterized protein n=1 Tax=Daldinia caldariorum TaxID=326644 RepID=UPI00200793FA|nr:uncharacterized protein F4812DRAFT_463274 [Daldinia caldariorum]KAI1463943.1 hypothetical protein F4812DRAFT_463274 [Daldinia caldariorum]
MRNTGWLHLAGVREQLTLTLTVSDITSSTSPVESITSSAIISGSSSTDSVSSIATSSSNLPTDTAASTYFVVGRYHYPNRDIEQHYVSRPDHHVSTAPEHDYLLPSLREAVVMAAMFSTLLPTTEGASPMNDGGNGDGNGGDKPPVVTVTVSDSTGVVTLTETKSASSETPAETETSATQSPALTITVGNGGGENTVTETISGVDSTTIIRAIPTPSIVTESRIIGGTIEPSTVAVTGSAPLTVTKTIGGGEPTVAKTVGGSDSTTTVFETTGADFTSTVISVITPTIVSAPEGLCACTIASPKF